MPWVRKKSASHSVHKMGTGTQKAPGASEKPSAGTDQWRRWGCRRTRTEPTRSTAIRLTARSSNWWPPSTMRGVLRLCIRVRLPYPWHAPPRQNWMETDGQMVGGVARVVAHGTRLRDGRSRNPCYATTSNQTGTDQVFGNKMTYRFRGGFRWARAGSKSRWGVSLMEAVGKYISLI